MSEAQKEYSKWLLKMLTIEITQQNFSLHGMVGAGNGAANTFTTFKRKHDSSM